MRPLLKTYFRQKYFPMIYCLGIMVVLMGILWTIFAWQSLSQPQSTSPPVVTKLSSVELKSLEPWDKTPLKHRTPLILIHGISPESGTLYNWANFLKYAQKEAHFQERFKVYFFKYAPARPISESSNQLVKTLHTFLADSSIDSIRVIAHSQGGLLYRHAMKDNLISAKTARVITIGAPLHGTPLAEPLWIEASLKKESRFSLVRLSHKQVYAVVRQKFPAFEQDFCWDNFDGALPPEILNHPKRQKRGSCGDNEHQVFHPASVQGAPWINYASFLSLSDHWDRHLRQVLQVPPRILAAGSPGVDTPTSLTSQDKLPLNQVFTKHMLFVMVHSSLASVPLDGTAGNKNKSQPPDSPPLMVYNDGVTPIISSLWMGRYLGPSTTEPKTPEEKQSFQKQLWQTLKSLKNQQTARLFEGMDHRDWMEGKTRRGTALVSDWLHPQEPEKPVFQWLLEDIQR